MDSKLVVELRSLVGEAKKSQPAAVMTRLKIALGDLLGEVNDLRLPVSSDIKSMQAAAGAARVANNEAAYAKASDPNKALHTQRDADAIEKLVGEIIQDGDQLQEIGKRMYNAQTALELYIKKASYDPTLPHGTWRLTRKMMG